MQTQQQKSLRFRRHFFFYNNLFELDCSCYLPTYRLHILIYSCLYSSVKYCECFYFICMWKRLLRHEILHFHNIQICCLHKNNKHPLEKRRRMLWSRSMKFRLAKHVWTTIKMHIQLKWMRIEFFRRNTKKEKFKEGRKKNEYSRDRLM